MLIIEEDGIACPQAASHFISAQAQGDEIDKHFPLETNPEVQRDTTSSSLARHESILINQSAQLSFDRYG